MRRRGKERPEKRRENIERKGRKREEREPEKWKSKRP